MQMHIMRAESERVEKIMNTELITIGEAMIVFIAENEGEFTDIESFSKGIAGAELNVCIGLSRLGNKVSYITRLGDDVFGRHIENIIHKEGIGADQITFDGDYSTGFYFKTKVKDGDPKVHYFRKNSAACQLSCTDIENADFTGAKVLHITGITAALSESSREAVYAAIEKARANNMLVTFDPNIRVQLWKSEAHMAEVLNDIASKCDIVLPGIKEGAMLTGKETKEEIADFYLNNGAKAVIIKDGAKGAYLKTLEEEKMVAGFKIEKVVDTVGAGDGFATGVLSGILDGLSYEEAVTRGNAIGARMVTSKEDNEFLPIKAELEDFMASHERY